jgi:hypothetical protein
MAVGRNQLCAVLLGRSADSEGLVERKTDVLQCF